MRIGFWVYQSSWRSLKSVSTFGSPPSLDVAIIEFLLKIIEGWSMIVYVIE